MIDRFALRPIRRDRVTPNELTIAGRQNATICERDIAVRPDLRDRDKFAVRKLRSCGSRGVGFELQSIAAAESEPMRSANIERIELRIS